MKTYIYILLLFVSSSVWSQQISEVQIEGNKKTRTHFISKITKIATETKLDSLLLEADVSRLKKLPAIAYAFYTVDYQGDNTCKVTYTIEENFTIIPSVNVYTTDDDEFAYRLGLYEFNGLGRNISFGGFYQRDIYSSYGVNFKAPYLFSNKTGLAINHQNLTTSEPVFLENGTADYKYNNTSYEVLGLYEFNFKNRIELGVNYFTETYAYKNGATSVNVPQNLLVHKLLYKLIYEYNNTTSYYHYVAGFKSMLNVQYVTSRDDALQEFIILFNDFIYYKRIGDKGNLASRLRMGVATNNDSPFAPFTVDNNVNVRGVGNTIDRGTAAIVLNTEYRYTLIEKGWFVLQSNVFVDAGTWRVPGGDLSDFIDDKNLRVYPGAGLRFIHKKIFNTVFRLDYGVGVTRDATQGFVIGIGQYF